jgi:glutamate-1-semialdehyde 2,1-aminomutase
MKYPNITAITQARTTSTRLPNKVLKEINGQSLLEIHLERIKKAKNISKLIVATTINDVDQAIVDLCQQLDITVSRGSEEDVLDRFYKSVNAEPTPQYIVRLTSDCPLIDAQLIDKVIDYCVVNDLDYCSNNIDPHYPDGQDIEVVKFSALKNAWQNAKLPSEREHVTPFIWKNSTFKGGTLFKSDSYTEGGVNYEHLRMTVDEQRDFDVISALINQLGTNCSWLEYALYLENNDNIKRINEGIIRNEGYQKSLIKEKIMKNTVKHRYQKSEEFLERALKTIPLGTQTFSKSKTQYPFGVSPYFIAKAKGAYVWDVDDNKYIDFTNSLAAITLGYNDPDVTKAVTQQLKIGTIFSLPHELEFLVAEKLCEMIPCAEMVRFGKNGSDATSGAIRVARAYTGREHILACGYHGWQDWYIGTTTRDKGVPQATKDLTHKFAYNDLNSLEEKLIELNGSVAAVILEAVNTTPPNPGFLEGVRDLAHKHGALLIFDETITGFRYANGGAQEFFNVTPDLATFGKGLANGYPVSAIVGKAKYMKVMEDIFFSFTFGGELLSLAASLTVLTKMQREPIIERMTKIGEDIIEQLNELIIKKELQHIFSVSGYPVWSFFIIKDTPQYNAFELKTLLMQEMFENGILMYGTHNISYSHNENHVKALVKSYAKYFDKVNIALTKGSLDGILKCEPLEPLFKVR